MPQTRPVGKMKSLRLYLKSLARDRMSCPCQNTAPSAALPSIQVQSRGASEASATPGPRVAVLIPCRNEAPTIRRVVERFRQVLPRAQVWVCDNGSTDSTPREALAGGARVIAEPRPGKGQAMWRLFTVVEADVYVLVDGDDTYDAACAPSMIEALLANGLDMVVGRRVTADEHRDAAYRFGHEFGNRVFAGIMSAAFGLPLTDVFSGFRVLSARFVRSFPALSRGFQIETELTVHALDLGLAVHEVPTAYGGRTVGSTSKLRTFRDGAKIAFALTHLYEQLRPAQCFGALAAVLAIASLALGIPVVLDYWRTGLVPRFPTAILASAVMLLAMLSAVCGIVLDSVGRGRREARRLAFLAWPRNGGR